MARYTVAPCRTYKGWSRKFSRNQNPIERKAFPFRVFFLASIRSISTAQLRIRFSPPIDTHRFPPNNETQIFTFTYILLSCLRISLSLRYGARVVRRGKKLYLNFERNDPRQPRHRVTDRVVYVYFRMRSWKKRLWQNIPKNITRPLFRVISPPASISRFKYKCTLTFYQAPAPDLYIRVNSRRIRVKRKLRGGVGKRRNRIGPNYIRTFNREIRFREFSALTFRGR